MKVLDYTGTNHLVSKTKTKLAKKVDKVVGKGLSTNDYTKAEKQKVADSLTDAPSDGKQYARQDDDWEELDLDAKADKTDLNDTNRSLDALWKLNKGQTWDFDVDNDTTYSKTVPSGSYYDTMDMFGGKSLVFNQLVQNGNFADTSKWSTSSNFEALEN